MVRKIKKKDIDKSLLQSIFKLESEWKQIHSIMKKSVEPSYVGHVYESLAQAKYIFLLKEAKRRNLRGYR